MSPSVVPPKSCAAHVAAPAAAIQGIPRAATSSARRRFEARLQRARALVTFIGLLRFPWGSTTRGVVGCNGEGTRLGGYLFLYERLALLTPDASRTLHFIR